MSEPNRDLTLFRRRSYWQYGLVLAALSYLFLWDPLRNWWAYETRMVEITSVRRLCAAFEQGKSMPTEIGDCAGLRTKTAASVGLEIRPRTFVGFSYRSPVDQSSQTGSAVRALDDAGKPVTIGSRIKVELSRREPGLFRVP